jgi:hypothetical protein
MARSVSSSRRRQTSSAHSKPAIGCDYASIVSSSEITAGFAFSCCCRARFSFIPKGLRSLACLPAIPHIASYLLIFAWLASPSLYLFIHP